MATITPRGTGPALPGDQVWPERLARSPGCSRPDSAARVYYTIQGGYDTHAGQLPTHARLLGELSGALRAFLDDLAAAQAGRAGGGAVLQRVRPAGGRERLGRHRPRHGRPGPPGGPGVRPGLVGRTPSLTDLEDGDLKIGIDFRRVYATVLEGWLGLPAKAALGGAFEPLPLFRA